jgi:DNA-binding IclR family transcriptional regulator
VKDNYTLKTLSNAIDVLDLFETEPTLSIKEIQEETHLNRTTLYRILYTLRHQGMLEVDGETGRYQLGMKIVHLASLLLQRMDIKSVAHPYLQELQSKTNETVHLVVLSNDLAAFVDKIAENEDINTGAYIGWTAPLYCTASGKLLLSMKEDVWVDNYINKTHFKRYTENTLDREGIRSSIDYIRKQGYSTDAEEMVEGLTCYAAPIKNHFGEVIAAVSVSGATTRMVKNKEQVIEKIFQTTSEITNTFSKVPQSSVSTKV